MKLFLASYFKQVAPLLVNYTPCIGEKVVFITTASKYEKVDFYVKADRKALLNLGFIVEDLDVSIEDPVKIQRLIEACDCIFVEGGNTFFLLQELKQSGADQLIKAHIEKNKMYIGASAGSIVLSNNIEYAKHMDDVSCASDLKGDYTALGIVDFSIVPHYQNMPFKKSADRIIKEYADRERLHPISNDQVIVVEGENIETLKI